MGGSITSFVGQGVEKGRFQDLVSIPFERNAGTKLQTEKKPGDLEDEYQFCYLHWKIIFRFSYVWKVWNQILYKSYININMQIYSKTL